METLAGNLSSMSLITFSHLIKELFSTQLCNSLRSTSLRKWSSIYFIVRQSITFHFGVEFDVAD